MDALDEMSLETTALACVRATTRVISSPNPKWASDCAIVPMVIWDVDRTCNWRGVCASELLGKLDGGKSPPSAMSKERDENRNLRLEDNTRLDEDLPSCRALGTRRLRLLDGELSPRGSDMTDLVPVLDGVPNILLLRCAGKEPTILLIDVALEYDRTDIEEENRGD